MRVLIAGGTGFIGRKLAHALASRGDAVVVLSRGRGDVASHGLPASAQLVTWNAAEGEAVDSLGLRRSSSLEAEVGKADAVVNLSGAGVADERWTKERVALIRSSRVDTTTSLARALARAPRPTERVLVNGSAVGIYGMRKDAEIVDEKSAHGRDVLAEIVEAWEASTQAARDVGVRVAIARIGLVLGADGGFLQKMLTPFKWFVGGPVGSGAQYLSWVHWRDTVSALLFAIDRKDFDGPFNLSAPNPVTMNEFARALGEALGRPSRFRVPAFAMKLAMGEGLSEIVLTGQRAMPRKLQDAGFAFELPDLGAALRDVVAARGAR